MELKQQIITALDTWIRQRPGLEFGNYGDVSAYRSELRSIATDKRHAQELLRAVENSGITGDALMAAFPRAYSGRLQCVQKDGKLYLDYCTGQYWPTEYRKAAAAVLASALWDYHREDYAADTKGAESKGDAIRRNFRRRFGRAIQSRWFD